MKADSSIGRTIFDEVAMIVLGAISVGLLVYSTKTNLAPSERQMLRWADAFIALIFLIELSIRCYTAKDRRRFARKHWWELLCCIPVLAMPQAPVLRLLRLLGLLRLIRLLTRTRVVIAATERLAAQLSILHLFAAQLSIAMAAAFAFHYFEHGQNANVHSFWDSFWWAIVTMSTVGYGDMYPVTTGGRIVAIALMYVGVGILGAFVALVASFLHNTNQSSKT